MPSSRPQERAFKTSWFTKTAEKAGIDDAALCVAVRQARAVQCDDLGGGVYKKRVSRNLYRSIILAKGRRYWVLAYLFAKQAKANITDAELKAFRDLAMGYEQLTTDQLAALLREKDLMEICDGDEH